jgi:dTDP-glucose pyrophosphorylase
VNKAVVLARGLGTRMRQAVAGAPALDPRQAEAADRGIKAMMPIGPGGRPFLDFILSALADAGYAEACLVVGPDHQLIREYYTTFATPRRIRLAFAVQAEPRGTADALLAATAFVDAEHVLVINGDNYYPVEALRALRLIESAGTVLFDPAALVRRSNIPEERLRAFALGVVEWDEDAGVGAGAGGRAEAGAGAGAHASGVLTALIEKPDAEAWQSLTARRALISMNCWRVPPALLDFCRVLKPSARGELELPHAIRDAIEAGMRFRVVRSEDGVLDLSGRGDIATVADRLRDVRVEV